MNMVLHRRFLKTGVAVRSLTIGLALSAIGLSNAMATTFNETADASNFLAAAQVLSGGTTQITGTIEDGQDTDLFKFSLGSNTTITIDMLFPGEDANLLVFNGLGQGLAGDDDDDNSCTAISVLASLDSCLTLNLDAGDYFIGVGDNNIGAFESVADFNIPSVFFSNDSGILGSPTAEIAELIGTQNGPTDINDTGPYTVNFSVAVDGPTGSAVPEPGTLALFGIGVVGLGLARRRRKTA
ncbi:MAG: PEP-CTERM sorting domain-containing protein [Rhodospirillaceae bacterium]|jgi:hypothetical protein|nr:PEP-CTERM sorting domain-containing protein [Rhodospirillaceae bacterium]MBT5666958.1 PEP-CTERM sorting domain-containing protein [Rhodospirillaceae bacterium]MBT5810823.1 PEP-CTERM sorting domain-containing protein [Rhodospirillaceae bacterium]